MRYTSRSVEHQPLSLTGPVSGNRRRRPPANSTLRQSLGACKATTVAAAVEAATVAVTVVAV